MTNERFWVAVGRELANERDRRGWTWADIERMKGPSAPTVRDNEQGRARTVTALNKHCAVLNVRLVDVFMVVIDRTAGRPTITPALASLVRRYERTTPAGQNALLAVHELCPETPLGDALSRAPRRGAKSGGGGSSAPRSK